MTVGMGEQSSMDATKQFSTRDAARILQASEAWIRTWSRMEDVFPQSPPGGRSEYTFQELLLLRTTKGLLQAGIPARRVRRIWSSLRRQLAADLPLTSIRILADGDRAVAWDGNAHWQPDSGQFLLDFSAEEIAENIVEAGTPAPTPDTPTLSAEQWFDLGCELESRSPIEARQAYVQALEVDPGFADAYINLGRLAHEAGELGKAEAHYRSAVQCAPGDATGHFNLAVLLEDRGRPDEAVHAYERAIALDPDGADAYYNLGILLEARGRRSEAIRHLMTARRLKG